MKNFNILKNVLQFVVEELDLKNGLTVTSVTTLIYKAAKSGKFSGWSGAIMTIAEIATLIFKYIDYYKKRKMLDKITNNQAFENYCKTIKIIDKK